MVIKPSRNVDIQICVKNETSNEKNDVTRVAYIFSVFACPFVINIKLATA